MKPKLIQSFMVMSLLLAGSSQGGDNQVERKFNESILNDPEYLVSYDEKYIEVGDDGLRISWVQTGEKFPGSSVKTQFGLGGDFDVTWRFEVNHLGTPQSGWGSGVLLRFDFRDLNTTGVSLQRQVRTEGAHVVSVDRTRHGQKEHDVQAVAIDPENEIEGFRVTRRGSTLEIAGIQNGAPLPAYWQFEVSQADVFPVGFHVHSGQAIADIDVVLKEFRITADRLLNRDEIPDPFASLKYAAMGLIACVFAAGGIWQMRSWQRSRTDKQEDAIDAAAE